MDKNLPAINMMNNIVATVDSYQIIKPEDVKFLKENTKHFGLVTTNTWKWRTPMQHLSIISDNYHPTAHSKFHQAILECDVQLQNSMYLAKDFEIKKLEIEELECDLEELKDTKRDVIKNKKIQVEIQFKLYELKQMEIAMDYRMKEVRSWMAIQEELIGVMKQSGLSDEEIWQKSTGEITAMFFQTLTNLQGIKNSTDGGERNNLVALAKFAVEQVKSLNILDKLKIQCNSEQLESLSLIESIK